MRFAFADFIGAVSLQLLLSSFARMSIEVLIMLASGGGVAGCCACDLVEKSASREIPAIYFVILLIDLSIYRAIFVCNLRYQ